MARDGLVPGGSHKNLRSVAAFCTLGARASTTIDRLILADAQTSGGLLHRRAGRRAPSLWLRELAQRGAPARAVIGEIIAGEPGAIEVLL